MHRALFPKAALLLVLILLLAAPVAQASERGAPKAAPVGLLDAFGRAWDFLIQISANNGCRIDPNGGCLPEQSATVEADNGCRIDPDGRCAP